ncbi:hypothetical protein EsDP_00004061 [Epichloe bromicola]|uniref:Cell wall galactomannoprotein n=1 Tax=Epichloe bromicola TaxID=79588 RepID=A0ABQ0CQL7_9HYPO
MKFTTPLVLLAAMSGARSLVIERDASAVKKVIDDISGGVSSLGQAAQSWNGSDIQPVLAPVENLIRLIQHGQAVVDGVDSVGYGGTMSLFPAVRNLDKEINHNFDTFRGRVGHVQKAKACDTVHEKLATVSTIGIGLIDAILGKVSSLAKSLAGRHTDHIKKMLLDAQGLFAQTNCVNERDAGAIMMI